MRLRWRVEVGCEVAAAFAGQLDAYAWAESAKARGALGVHVRRVGEADWSHPEDMAKERAPTVEEWGAGGNWIKPSPITVHE